MVRIIAQSERTQVQLRAHRQHGMRDPHIVILFFHMRRTGSTVVCG